jgi:O-antigen biosynthesis protein
MKPLVTCLCLTRNRREWLPKAIACFAAQTYEPRELLIVADGEDVSDLVPPEDSRVRLVCTGGRMTIGAKRNFGCALASGDLIAHWDDDDYSAPGRLADQVDRLMASGLAVTGYGTLKFTDGARWWLYTAHDPRKFATGTSLLYRKTWWSGHHFVDDQVGEDNTFVALAAGAGELVSAPAGEMMHATIHQGNTVRKPVSGHNYKEIAE